MTLTYTYDGAALTHDIAPTSVSLPSSAEKGEPSMGSLIVEDPGATLALRGHRPFVIEESACSQPRLWTGWTTERGSGRSLDDGQFVGASARIHDVTIVDLNALFNFRILSGTDANRPAETWNARIAWLVASDYLAGLIEDTGYIVSNTQPMDAADYRNGYASAVLDDLVDRLPGSELNYFAFWDVTAAAVGLWFGPIDEAVSDSTLRISNVPADVDSTTTFAPDPDARLAVIPEETYSEVVIEYSHGTKRLFRSRESTAVKYIRRGTTIQRPYTGGVATATAQAEAFLDRHANEQDRITVSIQVPRAAVGLVTAGQRMDVKFSHLTGYTTFTSMRVVRLTVSPTDDLALSYLLALELLAPRPAAGTGGGCVGATASGTYPRIGSDVSDATGNVFYWRPGITLIEVPTPFAVGDWHFSAYATTSCGVLADWAGDDVQNLVRCLVVGPGTITVHMQDGYACTGAHTLVAKLQYAGPSGPVTVETQTGGTTFTFTVPADGYCTHWVDVEDDGSVSGSKWGFLDFEWVAGEVDTVIPLPPPPGVPVSSASAPTVNDDAGDGYSPGQIWIDTSTNQSYILVDSTLGAAVWVLVSQGNVTLYDGYATKADGVPVVADSGQTWTQYPTSGTDELRVVSGQLTNTTASSVAAGYQQRDLGAAVTRIGADFTLGTQTTDNGAIGLVIFKTAIASATIPDSNFHLVVTRLNWQLGKFVSNTFTQIAYGAFAAALACDGATVHHVDAVLNGDTASILLPDGTAVSVTDAAIGTTPGHIACFEVYALDASTDAKAAAVNVWADASAFWSSHQVPEMSPNRLYPILVDLPFIKPVTALWAPSSTDVAIPAYGSGPSEIDTAFRVTATVPPSGGFVVDMDGYVKVGASTEVFWNVLYVGGSVVGAAARPVNGWDPVGPYQLRHARIIVPAGSYAPGTTATFSWAHWCTTTNAGTVFHVDLGSGYAASMTVSPL
jgi:hypothetical protein